MQERHYCRNPRCRSKLKQSVADPRDAFCARGCHASFYRHRCLVCEGKMARKTENQLVCGKRRCRNALRAGQIHGRYLASSDVVSPLGNPIKSGIKNGLTDDRAWRIVAGPELSSSAFHCATLGAAEAIEAINRTNARHWREYNAKAEEGCLIKRHDPPVVSVPRQRTPANNRTGSYTRSPSEGCPCVKTDSWEKGPLAE
jgi:hypothetical protein